MLERLQKVLAENGIGSRRECETLIQEGRVEVNKHVVTKMGSKVNPQKDAIRVDGEPLRLSEKKVYAVNKPKGVVSTSQDPSGRMRVIDLISTDHRIYNVGRLDKDSEGLIIVTNDGDLANRLTHPKFGVEKTYLIQVFGHPTREQMSSLESGVHLAEGVARIKSFQFKRKQKNTTEIEIVLDEGRNREIRRLLAAIGHKVLSLSRIGIGAYFLEGVAPGGHKQLTAKEISLLTQNPKRKKRAKASVKKSPAKPKHKSANDSRSSSSRASSSRSRTSKPSDAKSGESKTRKTETRKTETRRSETRRSETRSSKKASTGRPGSASKTAKQSGTSSRKPAGKKTSKRVAKKSAKKSTKRFQQSKSDSAGRGKKATKKSSKSKGVSKGKTQKGPRKRVAAKTSGKKKTFRKSR